MKTIKARVTAFRDAEDIRQLAATGTAYRKMVQQIDKYWDKLFADRIAVTSAHGVIEIQPQRTNNLMERFFRDMKRGDRKKSGTRALSRTLTAMLADTPLVKNLENPDYMTIVLKGKANLAERFADIDRALARQTLRDAQKAVQKYPKHMGKLFKIPHLPAKLSKNPLTLAASFRISSPGTCVPAAEARNTAGSKIPGHPNRFFLPFGRSLGGSPFAQSAESD